MVHDIAYNFDKQSGVPHKTSAHKTSSEKADIQNVTMVLHKKNTLSIMDGRAHTLPNISMTPLPLLKKDKLLEWIHRKHKKQLSRCVMAGADSESEESSSGGH